MVRRRRFAWQIELGAAFFLATRGRGFPEADLAGY